MACTVPQPLVIPCPTKIDCPGTDSPFANLTMEAPDSELFIGMNFGSGLLPRMGWTYRNPRGFGFCGSFVSQAAANICARHVQFQDQVDQPPGGDGGDWHDQDGNLPEIFHSQQQACTVFCNGNFNEPFTYVLGAGAVDALNQEDADAAAQSEACQVANLNRVCIGNFDTSACLGEIYNSSAVITGGVNSVGPYTFAVVGGDVPTGLQLTLGSTANNLNALFLQGIPTAPGTYTFTVRVTNSIGNAQQKTFSIVVMGFATPSGDTIDDYTVGSPYSYQFTGTGGTPPYTFTPATESDASVIAAAGLTLSTSGLLSGTPTQNGEITFNVRITDSGP